VIGREFSYELIQPMAQRPEGATVKSKTEGQGAAPLRLIEGDSLFQMRVRCAVKFGSDGRPPSNCLSSRNAFAQRQARQTRANYCPPRDERSRVPQAPSVVTYDYQFIYEQSAPAAYNADATIARS
jgi:hypothetical protein